MWWPREAGSFQGSPVIGRRVYHACYAESRHAEWEKKATPKVMVHFYWLLIGSEHRDWFSRLCIEIDCETRKLCHAMKRG